MLDHGFTATFDLTTELFIRANTSGSGLPILGYIKPLMRRAALGDLRYDEGLKVAEDYDLVVRLLARGAKGHVIPDPTYLYRRHGSSISHRLSVSILHDMIDSQTRFAAAQAPHSREVEAALNARLKRLENDLAYERLVEAIKSRQVARAAGELLKSPGLIINLLRSFQERTARSAARPPSLPASPSTALILSDKVPEGDSLIRLHALASQYGADKVVCKTVPQGFLTEPPVTDARRYRELWALTEALGRPEALHLVCQGQAAVNAAGYLPVATRIVVPDTQVDTQERGLG